MPKTHILKYCHHTGRNKGFVKLNGQFKYLPGAYGSEESLAEYKRLTSVWLAGGGSTPPSVQPASQFPRWPRKKKACR
jgi:hypothetical protein